jgi:hypothetical protein
MLSKFLQMLSLTTMLAMPTCQGMKLTENSILVSGIGRGRAKAFHALGNKVISLLDELESILHTEVWRSPARNRSRVTS